MRVTSSIRTCFEEIRLRRTIDVPCRHCGKKVRRVVNDFQTINPLNKNSSGVPKDRKEIHAELKKSVTRKAEEAVKTGRLCGRCQQGID